LVVHKYCWTKELFRIILFGPTFKGDKKVAPLSNGTTVHSSTLQGDRKSLQINKKTPVF